MIFEKQNNENGLQHDNSNEILIACDVNAKCVNGNVGVCCSSLNSDMNTSIS